MTATGPAYAPAALRALIEQAAGPELGPTLAFKPMFGGIMGYVEGWPFASLSSVGLALKLPEAERTELLAMPGAAPLRYNPDDAPSRTYVLVPLSVLDDVPRLAAWIDRSARASLAQAPKPTRRARS